MVSRKILKGKVAMGASLNPWFLFTRVFIPFMFAVVIIGPLIGPSLVASLPVLGPAIILTITALPIILHLMWYPFYWITSWLLFGFMTGSTFRRVIMPMVTFAMILSPFLFVLAPVGIIGGITAAVLGQAAFPAIGGLMGLGAAITMIAGLLTGPIGFLAAPFLYFGLGGAVSGITSAVAITAFYIVSVLVLRFIRLLMRPFRNTFLYRWLIYYSV